VATAIYHFTHVENFVRILEVKEMVCDRLCQQSGLTVRNIGYSSLKAARIQTAVEVEPYGTLGDYVPFYFGWRSPMLFVYTKGYVTGKPEDTDDLVYLVSSAEAVSSSGLRFAFTDGHPIREPKAFFNDLADLHNVDLALMKATMWTDTDADPDKKRRRQAEFLVHRRFPLVLVLGIATKSAARRAWVNGLLKEAGQDIQCVSRPGWYY
jgi:hypothetical protein